MPPSALLTAAPCRRPSIVLLGEVPTVHTAGAEGVFFVRGRASGLSDRNASECESQSSLCGLWVREEREHGPRDRIKTERPRATEIEIVHDLESAPTIVCSVPCVCTASCHPFRARIQQDGAPLRLSNLIPLAPLSSHARGPHRAAHVCAAALSQLVLYHPAGAGGQLTSANELRRCEAWRRRPAWAPPRGRRAANEGR